MIYDSLLGDSDALADHVAIVSKDVSVTYRQLRDWSYQAADVLRAYGINQQSCVALDCGNGIDAIFATMGLAHIGCKWVQATPAAFHNKLLFLTHAISDEKGEIRGAPTIISLEKDWYRKEQGALGKDERRPAFKNHLKDIAFIGQSSGTTGTPKFFSVDVAMAMARGDPRRLLDPSPRPVIVSLFHTLHAASFSNLMRVLKSGGTWVFGLDKEFWVEQGVTLVIGSPAHIANLFTGRLGNSPTKLPRAWIGGAAMHKVFARQALEHFESLIYTYGQGEGGIVCSRTIRSVYEASESRWVGPLQTDCELQIVDDKDQEVAVDVVGNLRVRSPLHTKGYIGADAANAYHFRNGWMYPGDLGFIDKQKNIFVTGRVADEINTSGTKINAIALDEIIQSNLAVLDGICFTEINTAGIERLSIVVALKPNQDLTKTFAELKAALAKKLGVLLATVRYYKTDTVPRNGNGKAARQEARHMAEQGKFDAIAVE